MAERATRPATAPVVDGSGLRRPPDSPPLPPIAWRPVLLAAATVAAVLTVFSASYGYHRDELYFRMLPPEVGYTDQPS